MNKDNKMTTCSIQVESRVKYDTGRDWCNEEASPMDPEKPDVYTAGSRKGPPPSYGSLFGKVKAMKEESTGNVEFVKNVVFMLLGSIGFTIFLGLILAIPIAMIVMGAMHLNDCPQERYIPIYLLVAGCFGVVRTLISIGLRCCGDSDEDEDSEEEQSHKPNSFLSVIDCFMFAWFIAGNVWVYRTQGDFSEDPDAPNYCDPTFYWFAFWITTSSYIGLLVACFTPYKRLHRLKAAGSVASTKSRGIRTREMESGP